uniref:Uncharacterized protein n=1 Tax=Rhizophora mucronata TaxID=61149 RepID=A0A2P2QBG0_RHIMU
MMGHFPLIVCIIVRHLENWECIS